MINAIYENLEEPGSIVIVRPAPKGILEMISIFKKSTAQAAIDDLTDAQVNTLISESESEALQKLPKPIPPEQPAELTEKYEVEVQKYNQALRDWQREYNSLVLEIRQKKVNAIGDAAIEALGMTDQDFQDKAISDIFAKDVPTGAKFWIVDDSELPADREFRDAWTYDFTLPHDGVGQ